jgi:hypothetical protein
MAQRPDKNGGRTGSAAADQVAAYKVILKEYIDRRPSGMRLKLATALGKHKSFISQITGPSYAMPIPVQHLATIFDICHFSPAERKTFLAAYTAAHPDALRRASGMAESAKKGNTTLQIEVPIVSDAAKQKEAEELIRQFARKVFALLGE